MPNNFRLTGNVYVSKEGNDANSGLTPELPKLTVQAGLNALGNAQTLVIGAGVYKEDLNRTFGSGTSTVIADGKVVLTPATPLGVLVSTHITSNYFTNWVGIEFRNYLRIESTGNVAFASGDIFTNCIIFGDVFVTTGNTACGGVQFQNTILINGRLYQSLFVSNNPSGFTLIRCILINYSFDVRFFINTLGVTNQIINSYIDSSSIIIAPSTVILTASNFNFNNIQGKISIAGNGAVSGANSNGVAQSFAQHRIDYPTFNVNSISANPLFNDVQNLNFTLQAASPHIRGASDFVSNIGGTEYAVYMKASDTELTSGATISNLTLQGNNSYVITSPNTTGSIISGAKLLQWPRTKPLTRIEWAGNLEFNKSVTAGTQGNQNVPDYETATSGAAAQPDRLCIRMRFSTQQTQPATSGEWDNDGLWTAGEYRLFEINSKPKVDINGIGNGSSSYVEFTGLGDIIPSWVQIDVILINNYNP